MHFNTLAQAYDYLKDNTDRNTFPNSFRQIVNIAKQLNIFGLFLLAQDILLGASTSADRKGLSNMLTKIKPLIRKKDK